MKLYFAGGETTGHLDKIYDGGGRNVLFSCFNIIDKTTWLEDNWERLSRFDNLFIDSGAFSAWAQGGQVDIEKYMNFLRPNTDRVTVYAALDVIGDWKGTKSNQEYMESKGFAPLPVFHSAIPREPYSRLEEMCEKYDYIALGGTAGRSTSVEQATQHFDRCFQTIGKHWKNGRKVRVHGFGVTQLDWLERFPFYSVDSTSWLAGEQYATVYNWETRKMKKYQAKDREIAKLADFSLLDKEGDSGYKARSRHNVREFEKMATYVTDLWKARGIEFDEVK